MNTKDLSGSCDFEFSSFLKMWNRSIHGQDDSVSLVSESNGPSEEIECSIEQRVSVLEKKRQAFGVFGKSSLLPKDQFREFLIHRRQINIGRFNEVWSNNRKEKDIADAMFRKEALEWNASALIPGPRNYTVVVDDHTAFSIMMDHLKQQNEIAIALKTDTVHSFIGMTVMIQISTNYMDYLIDVFPLNKLIMESLKTLLEDRRVLKYVFEGVNDFLCLKRDFLIDVVHACDVQLLMQEILRTGALEDLLKNIPVENKKPWYIQFIGKRHSLTQKPQLLQWEKNASEVLMNFQTVRDLFYPEIKTEKLDKAAGVSPLNDSSGYTTKQPQLMKNDVHLLLRIVSFIKANLCKDKGEKLFSAAYEKTKVKLFRTFSPTFPVTFEAYLFSQNAIKIPSQHLPMFRAIFNWRRLHASIVDEFPSSLFSDESILDLIEKKPNSVEEMVYRVGNKGAGNEVKVSETLFSWNKTLYEILLKGESHVNQLMSIECHNCLKVGHAAWGCPEPPNRESIKITMREHPEWKRRQNHRRQINKRRNALARRATND